MPLSNRRKPILKVDYVARHVAATGKNWWQVALEHVTARE
jgi:hypothetical protein